MKCLFEGKVMADNGQDIVGPFDLPAFPWVQ